jgi:hypothetical protein
MKCLVIPVTNGATGNVSKGLKKVTVNDSRKAFDRFSIKKRP